MLIDKNNLCLYFLYGLTKDLSNFQFSIEMKKTYLAALERREAMLLSLVDRQVDVKQEILAEMRLEVATARARVLATQEEGTKRTVSLQLSVLALF